MEMYVLMDTIAVGYGIGLETDGRKTVSVVREAKAYYDSD